MDGFAGLLKRWRTTRRLSQEQLAFEAEISTRHLSFLETGRSQASREMALVLGNALELPLRERNTLLVAAGFAPVYRETAIDAGPMQLFRGPDGWTLHTWGRRHATWSLAPERLPVSARRALHRLQCKISDAFSGVTSRDLAFVGPRQRVGTYC